MPQRSSLTARRLLPESDAAYATLLIAGLAFYYLVPQPLLALPGLILFAACAWRRLPLAFSLLPLTFPFWYVPKRVAATAAFPLSEIAILICAAILLLQWSRLARPHSIRTRLRRTYLVLLHRTGPLLTVGAAFLTLGVGIGVLIARRQPEALRAFRWEIIEPLLYLALLILTLRGSRYLRWLVGAFLTSAALFALLALLQLTLLHVTFTPLADGNRLIASTATRATALYFGSGNSLGALLERALPLALALLLVPRATPRPLRLLTLACTFLLALGLYLIGSRGAEIAAAVACLFVLLLAVARRWLTLAILTVLALLALWQRDALDRSLLNGHGGSAQVRPLLWRAALNMIRDHPLFGIGPDQFLYYYSSHYTSSPYWIPYENGHPTPALYEPNLSHPHNLPLELWLSGGLLALGGFALILCDLARRFLHLWRTEHATGWRAALALGAIASLLAGLIHGLVDSAYFAPDLALDLWWVAALLILLTRLHPTRPS